MRWTERAFYKDSEGGNDAGSEFFIYKYIRSERSLLPKEESTTGVALTSAATKTAALARSYSGGSDTTCCQQAHNVCSKKSQPILHAPINLALLLLVLLLFAPHPTHGGSYNHTNNIFKTLLSSSNYNPDIRPLLNQSDVLYVYVGFELVSIMEVSDVMQSFKCNGFMAFFWTDEILRWDPADYGGEFVITPKTKDIFRPRLALLNTMGERDLFQDDYAPFNVYSNGVVTWIPGSVFPVSCQLDLTNYPFDVQACEISMALMSFGPPQLQFLTSNEEVSFQFFTENGEWKVTGSNITSPPTIINDSDLTTLTISFTLKRKAQFLIISIILPIVFLSLLNLLVFLIPVESGEKISYGITVLLALSVFMSIMSAMLPRSSESMPLMITYIFILLTISVLTVVDSIIIVKLHHMEEQEEKSQKARQNFKAAMPKIALLRRTVAPVDTMLKNGVDPRGERRHNLRIDDVRDVYTADTSSSSQASIWPRSQEKVKVNKYKLIGKYIDLVSLVVFGVIWMVVTIGFMVAIAA